MRSSTIDLLINSGSDPPFVVCNSHQSHSPLPHPTWYWDNCSTYTIVNDINLLKSRFSTNRDIQGLGKAVTKIGGFIDELPEGLNLAYYVEGIPTNLISQGHLLDNGCIFIAYDLQLFIFALVDGVICSISCCKNDYFSGFLISMI